MFSDRQYEYRQFDQAQRFGAGTGWSAVKTLIVVNIAVFVLQYFLLTRAADFILSRFALIPHRFLFEYHWWTIVTYGFMHGDPIRSSMGDNLFHIFFNMFALFIFGRQLESHFGKKWFLGFYFYCLIGSGVVIVLLPYIVPATGLDVIDPRLVRTVGASGAVLGCVTAFAFLYPNARLYLFIFFLPIPVKAKWLAIGYAAISVMGVLDRSADGISHAGHLGGIVFGFAYFLALKRGWVGLHPMKGFNPLGKLRGLFGSRRDGYRRIRERDRDRDAGGPSRLAPKPPGWSHMSDGAIRDEMDRILKKVGESGIHSLSGSERQFLQDISKYYQDRGA